MAINPNTLARLLINRDPEQLEMPWATVETVSPVLTVRMATGPALPVTANAAGPLEVGDRVWCVWHKRALTVCASPSQADRMNTDTGWVAVPLSAGFTGQAWVRRVGVMVELRASVTGGTIPEGNTGFATCPEGFRPTGEDARFGAYFGGAYQGVGYVTPGGTVGVTQRTGGTRADVRGRGNWLLN